MMKVYWASVEFDIVNPASYENCVGGFVYLFFKAVDVIDAIPIIREAIENEELKLNKVEFVSQYEEVPWDSEEEQDHYDSLAKEAESGEEVVWDEISAYESNED